MDNLFSIRQVEVKDIYRLRLRNLRQGRPIDTVHFVGDELDTTLHFAIFADEVMVGCASLMVSANDSFEEKKQYQLRGMAVDEQYRKQGYGNALLKYAEWLALNRKIDFIWLNARCDVQNFYAHFGYLPQGEPFEIPDVCQHIVMYKRIQPHACHCCGNAKTEE